MTWIQLRSRRDPAFWLPLLMIVVVLVPSTFGIHVRLSGWAAAVEEKAAADPEAALDEAARVLRLSGWAFGALFSAVSLGLFRFFQLARRQRRLPPAGWWSLGAHRAALGARAERMAAFGLGVSVLLLAASLGFVWALENLLRVLLEGTLAA